MLRPSSSILGAGSSILDLRSSILDPVLRALSSILYPLSSILYPLSSVALVLLLCWFLFFYRLADRDLWSSHEGRAAQDAQTMLSDHQWGLPRLFDGKIELQKPPFYYWLVAGIAALRGGEVDAWCVRLPAAGAALGSVLLVFTLGACRGRPLAGTIAALMLATALHYTWLARIGRIDMPLTFALAVALGGFYLGLQCRRQPKAQAPGWQALSLRRAWAAEDTPFADSGRATLRPPSSILYPLSSILYPLSSILFRACTSAWTWFLVAYVAGAVAVLLKGPIGLILLVGAAGCYLWLEGELPSPSHGRSWLRLAGALGLGWGLPLILILVLPWYTWANVHTHGKLFEVFFWKHNFERGFGGGSLTAHPWWFYGPRLVFDLLPWSLLLPASAWLLIRRGWWHSDPEARFGLIWLVSMLFVLSCSRFKRADYLLPAYPGAALFLGSIAERWYRECKYRRSAVAGFAALLGGAALGWCIYLGYFLPKEEPHQEFRRFAHEIRRLAPAPELILFFRTEAHALAFHVGRPIDTILEWENLDIWSSRPGTYYVVMPPENADEWPRYLQLGQLEEVLRSSDLAGRKHAHPLVLLRTRPGAGPVQKSGLSNHRS